MSSTNGMPGSIEATIALLQAELPRLEERQQDLEKELVAVTDRLESVRGALTALQTLSATGPVRQPASALSEPDTKPAPSASTEAELATGPKATTYEEKHPADEADTPPAPQTDTPAAPQTDTPARPTPRKATTRTEGKPPAKKTSQQKQTRRSAKTAPAKRAKTPPAKKTTAAASGEAGGGLTEQVLSALKDSGSTPVRARDVNQALKRDDTPGSINAVRSTLDRLVATSRAHRAGRGLYQAAPAD
ncbi:hypothetical protein RND61_03310 [Streptomyces sp. TRM76323]|uniref:Prephenate dehydrogenase n=1 Tax=Streptomyces tamarix TaxID=3078565 RepID=A0ABU3QEE0_9ACTN|nr:hypothetical protein [Streptomyces tamarix]MDT9681108.1 hypothetical protein [Streptomyces tamarix]